jgi:hypothetical protein
MTGKDVKKQGGDVVNIDEQTENADWLKKPREFSIVDDQGRITGDAALHDDMLQNQAANELGRKQTVKRLRENGLMTEKEIRSLFQSPTRSPTTLTDES